MGNRADRRAEEAESKKALRGGRSRATTPIRRHVLQLARDFTDEDVEIEPLLDDPGFDEALSYMASDMRGVAGESYASLIGVLKTIAGERKVGSMSSEDTSVETFATLFLVPLHGTEGAIRAVAADGDAFGLVASSIKEFGVAHPDSHVLMSRSLVRPGSIAAATPGAVRGLLDAMLVAFADGHPTEEGTAAMDGYVASAFGSPETDGLPVPGACMLGLRVLVDDGWSPEPPVDFIDDFITPGWHGSTEGSSPEEFASSEAVFGDDEVDAVEGTNPDVSPDHVHEPEPVDAWVAFVDGFLETVADGSLGAFPPCGFDEAMTPLVTEAVIAQVEAERRLRGLDPSRLVDVVHYHFGKDTLTTCYVQAGEILGPVDVPYAMLGEDWDHVEYLLEDVADELTESTPDSIFPHDLARTMPHLSGNRQ